MPDDQYRDRYVHEFDEDMDQYQNTVQQEVQQSVSSMDDEAFVKSYSELPESDDPHVAMQDDEALEGYRHMANGEWDRVNQGQVISLYRLVDTIQDHGTDMIEDNPVPYEQLQRHVDELDYVITTQNELDRVEEDYTTFDD